MGIESDILADWDASLAALAWQFDCGADEAIADLPIDRYTAAPPPKLPQATAAAVSAPAAGARAAPPVPAAEKPREIDAVAVAQAVTVRATSLEELRQAALEFELCELKKGARNTVFSDGNPKARLLVLGEAPGRDEDIEGRPFVGRAGQLLDRMFAAIGLSRHSPDSEAAFYITNVMFWRPEGNRDPTNEEIAMMRPFVERHIALVDPDVVVAVGNTPLEALTGQRGILRVRGTWAEAYGKPVMPMTHPAYLLRNPAAKREAWADLLAVKARLGGAK